MNKNLYDQNFFFGKPLNSRFCESKKVKIWGKALDRLKSKEKRDNLWESERDSRSQNIIESNEALRVKKVDLQDLGWERRIYWIVTDKIWIWKIRVFANKFLLRLFPQIWFKKFLWRSLAFIFLSSSIHFKISSKLLTFTRN